MIIPFGFPVLSSLRGILPCLLSTFRNICDALSGRLLTPFSVRPGGGAWSRMRRGDRG